MANNQQLALETWWRYQYLRDNGHLKFVKKFTQCDKYFAGDQWDPEDKATLNHEKRPALTINKILAVIASITGEQIFNRTEISFRPSRAGATEETAEALTRVFMQIGDNNQLSWTRTDVYMDGLIGSRGFYDARLGFSDSLVGEAQVRQLNPKNVLIDSDADTYDPKDWNDVLITKWLTLDDIEIAYGKKWRKKLEGSASDMSMYEYDSQDFDQDSFGTSSNAINYLDAGQQPVMRVVRILERQWKKLDKRECLVNLTTGDIRDIPDDWTPEELNQFLDINQEYGTIKRIAPRIRWTVCAGMEVLHDDWSPYKHFTVIPFFPYFRRGTTIGVVENLLDPQMLVNKVSSQELHVVNTTANSGWIVKTGSLHNMTMAELEERGAMTGLVLEVDEVDDVKKITPNQVPTGLERISYKAEEHIKTISGQPDANTGFAREDVSAKALKANQVKASANFAVVQDNLNRSDHYLAKVLLDLVQTYYSEERLIFITTDPLRKKSEPMLINEVSPEGKIINDLTLGEYAIVVTNQPERDTLEDSTFAQGVEMRKELNIPIPDSVLIKTSRLTNKAEIIQAIEDEQNSPEAQQNKQIEQADRMADVRVKESDAARNNADTRVKMINAAKGQQELNMPIDPETQLRVKADLAKSKYEIDEKIKLGYAELASKERLEMAKIAQQKTAVAKTKTEPRKSK